LSFSPTEQRTTCESIIMHWKNDYFFYKIWALK
jgi:hypothetical protein